MEIKHGRLIRVDDEDIKGGCFNIPEGLTSIGSFAFVHCYGLKSITIPDSVIKMGIEPFEYFFGTLTDITVDKNNKYYSSEDGVLFDKEKTKLIKCPAGRCGNYTVPDGVTYVGDGAFECCESLTSIIIPEGVTRIGAFAFSNCINLESITIPDSVTRICGGAFNHCPNLQEVVIPNSMAVINKYAFDKHMRVKRAEEQIKVKPPKKGKCR